MWLKQPLFFYLSHAYNTKQCKETKIFGNRKTKIKNPKIFLLLVPPEKPLLIDEDGNQVMDVFGPFFEGFEIELF